MIRYPVVSPASAIITGDALVVADLAALKALPSPYPRAVMTQCRTDAGDEAGGLWVFQTNDQSGNVTADVRSSIWAAPTSASSGASGAWQRQFTGPMNAKWFGAKGDGIAVDTATLQDAVNYSASLGNGLLIPAGTYLVGNIIIPSNSNIQGSGIDSTILKRTGNLSAAIFEAVTYGNLSATRQNIAISGITFDVNNDPLGSCIYVLNVTNFTVRDCIMKNHPIWGIHVGIEGARASTTTITCFDILIENCRFPTCGTTYEGVALFNAKNCVVSNCYFAGKTSSVGIGVGLYQVLVGVTVENCTFENIEKGSYYAISVDEVTYSNCRFLNCTSLGIQGANESDNGLFGRTDARGVSVVGCYFYNCDVACIIGAVTGGYVGDCVFEANIDNALVIAGGLLLSGATSAPCLGLMIQGCMFRNNNSGNTAPAIHPGVLFNRIGGALQAFFVGCTWVDDQGTPTQLNAVSFDGAFTWSAIYFIGCSMPSYGAGNTISAIGGSTITGIQLSNCTNVGALAAGSYNTSVLVGSTYTAGAPAATGYVLMYDASGATYKVLVST